MDLARVFVRTVVRAFYDTQHIVLVDALVNHSALSVADLALVMDMGASSQKIVQKLLGRLKEGGLVSTFTRQEIKEGATKPINREYFYIDYRKAIDATKYRVHILDEKIKLESKPTQEKMELRCPRCKSEYTIIEVMDSLGASDGFICKRCSGPLSMISADTVDMDARDDTPAKFNKQFERILSLLQQIDNALIPAITGQQAMDAMVPVPRNEVFNPGARSVPVAAPINKPQAVKGVATGPEKIEISITTAADHTAEQDAAEADRRAKIAAQNQLPEWHTRSTITGDLTAAGVKATNAAMENGVAVGLKEEEPEDKKADDPTLEAYYTQYIKELEEERAAADRSEDEDDEDDDDDDDEFEDIPATAPVSAAGTPSAKRPKMDIGVESAVPSPTPTPAPTGGSEAMDGESDEDEFEDVN